MDILSSKIAVIGLGYVGLPLAVEFGKKYKTVGFDINESRIRELREGKDHTLEIESEMLTAVLNQGLFSVSNQVNDISDCNVFIVTVPTPIDKHKTPLLTPLVKASETIGKVLKKVMLSSTKALFIRVLLKMNVCPYLKRSAD